MDRTRTPKLLLRQRLPLAARSQYKDDASEDFAGLHGFTATSWTPKISPFLLAFSLQDERFNPLPEIIGYRPRSNRAHDSVYHGRTFYRKILFTDKHLTIIRRAVQFLMMTVNHAFQEGILGLLGKSPFPPEFTSSKGL